jgi:hypothetical protein
MKLPLKSLQGSSFFGRVKANYVTEIPNEQEEIILSPKYISLLS